jgi:BASS family bile acid:Na+ symporter
MNTGQILPIVVILAIIAGFFIPAFEFLEPYMLVLLGVLIWASSFDICPSCLLDILKKPKKLLITWIVLFAITPVICWYVATLVLTDPLLIAGYTVVSMAPVAVATLIWTKVFKGDSNLALTLVGTTTILTIVVIPVLSLLLLRKYVAVDAFYIFRTLLIVVLIPFIAAYFSQKMFNFKKYSNYIILPIFFLVIGTIVSVNADKVIGPLTIPLTVLALFHCSVNFGIAWIATIKWKRAERVPIVVGTTVRNIALSIAIAIANFGALATLPSAFIVLVQMAFLFVLLLVWKK